MTAGRQFRCIALSCALVLSASIPSAAEAEGVSSLRSAIRNLTRPVMESVRTVIRPTLRIAQDEAGSVVDLKLDNNRRYLLTVLGDGTARLWDLERGVQLGSTLGNEILAGSIRGEGDALEVVAIRRDGSLIAIHPDGEIRIVDRKVDGGELSTGPAISRNGDTVAFRSGSDNAWYVKRVRPRLVKRLPDADPAMQPVLWPDGSKVAYRTVRGTVAAIDGGLEGSETPAELEGCRDSVPITAGAVLANGDRVVLGDEEGNVCLWSIPSQGRPQRHLVQESAYPGAIRVIVADQGGNHIGVGGNSSTVHLWDITAGFRLAGSLELGGHFTGPLLLDIDRGWLLVGESRGATGIYSVDTKKRIARLISTDLAWAVLDSKGRFDGPQDGVDALVWAGDTAAQTLPVDAFSESYFEPGLLGKLGPRFRQFLNEGIRDLSEDGYIAPPAVSLERIDGHPADREGRATLRVRLDPAYPRRDVLAIRLYHNGKLVHSEAMTPGAADAFVDFAVRLVPGENTFQAVGIGPGGIEGPPALETVERVGVPSVPSRMRVVAVGIGDYVRPDWKLEYTRNDAHAVVAALREQGSRLYSDVSVVTLLDSSANAVTIEEHISRRALSPHDVLVIFFAGHGYALPAETGGWEWYLMPYTHAWSTGSGSAADMIRQHGISSRRLLQSLTSTQVQRIFLILDSCRSGAVVDTVASSAGRTLDDAAGQKTLRKVARVGGIHVLAASRADEDAIELLSVPHGALTYLVLEGIRGAADENRNGRISVGEIIGYATREMPLLSQRLVKETISQKPVGYSRGRDFELAGG